MKRIIFLVSIVALLPFIVSFTDDPSQSQKHNYIIQIYSMGESPVEFEGAYVQSGAENAEGLHHFTSRTPMTFSVYSEVLYVMLTKISGNSNLGAKLLEQKGTQQYDLVSGNGSKSIILVQNNDIPEKNGMTIF